jgi:hypothetical protein
MNETQMLMLLFAAAGGALSVGLCASEIREQNRRIAARKKREREQREAEQLEAQARKKKDPAA